MRILCGASLCRSACASVFTAMNSTPIISARIIRFTALLPPPPTPMTLISAKCSASDRSGMRGSPARCAGCLLGEPGARAGLTDSSEPERAALPIFPHADPELSTFGDSRWTAQALLHMSSVTTAERSAREEPSHPVHEPPQPAIHRAAGGEADRLRTDVARPPQQEPDGGAEGRV